MKVIIYITVNNTYSKWLLSTTKVKVKICNTPSYRSEEEFSSAFAKPAGGYTTELCGALPLQCQARGYLPGRTASQPINWYRITLLGHRGTGVFATWPHYLAGAPDWRMEVRLDNLNLRAFDMRLSGRHFDSRSVHCLVTILRKIVGTHVHFIIANACVCIQNSYSITMHAPYPQSNSTRVPFILWAAIANCWHCKLLLPIYTAR